VTEAEKVLIIQALREAASYTRLATRKREYLLLAAKLRGDEANGKAE
jgi:hypothetical protein